MDKQNLKCTWQTTPNGIGYVKVTHSFQELKNRVIYSDNNEKSTRTVVASNTASISTYGLLTNIETVDTKKQTI